MLRVTYITTNIILVFALISCHVAEHIIPKNELKSFGRNVVTNVELQKRSESSMNSFRSSYSRPTTTHYTTVNSSTIEFHITVSSDIQLISRNFRGDSSVEFDILTVKNTMITGIKTGITKVLSSSLTAMQIEIMTLPMSTEVKIESGNPKETPIKSLKLAIKTTSDASLEEIAPLPLSTIDTFHNMYIVKAEALKVGTRITKVCTESSTIAGSLTMELRPTTTTCYKSLPTRTRTGTQTETTCTTEHITVSTTPTVAGTTTTPKEGTSTSETSKASKLSTPMPSTTNTVTSTKIMSPTSTTTTSTTMVPITTTAPSIPTTTTAPSIPTTTTKMYSTMVPTTTTTPSTPTTTSTPSTPTTTSTMVPTTTSIPSTTPSTVETSTMVPTTTSSPSTTSSTVGFSTSTMVPTTTTKPSKLLTIHKLPLHSLTLPTVIGHTTTTLGVNVPLKTSWSPNSEGLEALQKTHIITTTLCTTSFKPIFSTSEKNYSRETSSVPIMSTIGLTTPTWHTDVTSSPSPTAGYCFREYSCVNCTTARVCAPTPGGQGLWEVLAQFSCPDYAPWCDSHSGTCSRVRTPECDLPVIGNFTCMRNGHFPDPNSCSDYYVCDNDVPLEFTCLYLSPYYSPLSQSCGNSSSDCVDYPSLCKGKSGLKVPVPRVNNLFLYCVDGDVEVVDRCIGAYRFDFDRQGCVPECPYAGLFPRDDDCAGYYQCSPSPWGDHYVMTNLNCSQGMAFSESAYQCIDRSFVPNCNATYIS